MELVYLWVEDYKNIYKQGFNFSPRFSCEFKAVYENKDGKEVLNEEKSELVICDKEDKNCKEKEECKKFCNEPYIKNFFDDNGNISVTAIVGKNGSGKSSVLKAFGHSWSNIYYIFYQNSQLYSNYFDKNTSKYNIQKKDINISHIIYLNKMFFMELDEGGFFNSNSLEKQNIYKTNFQKGLYHKKLFQGRLDKKDNILDRNLFHQNILEVIFYGSLNPSYFKPKYINISFNDLHRKFNQRNEVSKIYHDYRIKLMELSIKKNKTNDDKKKEEVLKKRLSGRAKYKVYLKSVEITATNSEEKLIVKFCKQNIEQILEFYSNNDVDVPNDEDIDKFLNKFTISNIDILLPSKKYLLEDFEKEFLQKNQEYNIFYYLYRIGFLEYDFHDDRGNYFSNLSSGEKSLFIDVNLILKYIDNNIKKNIESLLFIDEPDLTLHPNWQKKYLSHIVKFLKEFFPNTKIHIILTSHSPFLLSDIPKQNIIFLDKDENGNCKVVDGLNEKKQTFGANIHTLLSDSFFMEDGLMGEFAKGKIDKAIKLLNQDKLNEKDLKYCEQIISIIGEPIVKNQLQRMLDSKRLKKVDEIDAIKQSMKAMQKRLDELEK